MFSINIGDEKFTCCQESKPTSSVLPHSCTRFGFVAKQPTNQSMGKPNNYPDQKLLRLTIDQHLTTAYFMGVTSCCFSCYGLHCSSQASKNKMVKMVSPKRYNFINIF